MNRIIVLVGLIIGTLSILFDSYISYFYINETTILAQERVNNIEEILFIKDYLGSLLNIETAQRGYLITQNKAYLEPYKYGNVFLEDETTQRLINQLKNRYMEKMKKIEELTEVRLQQINTSIRINDTKSLEEAKKLLANNSGKQTMDKMRQIFDHIILQEKERFNKITNQVYSNFRKLFYITAFSRIFSFSMIACCLLLLSSDIKKRQNTEEELSHLHRL